MILFRINKRPTSTDVKPIHTNFKTTDYTAVNKGFKVHFQLEN